MAFYGNPRSVSRGVTTRTFYGVLGNRLTQSVWQEEWRQECDSRLDTLSIASATWTCVAQPTVQKNTRYYVASAVYEKRGPRVNHGMDATATAAT